MNRRRVDLPFGAASRLAEMRLPAYQRRQKPRREKGQILVLFTMAIVVLMLFASIVIDLGLLRNNRQILVNAVDSGALAGGTLMPVDGCNIPQSTASACPAGSRNGNAQAVVNLVRATVQATYPGIPNGDFAPGGPFAISFRCLIGVDTNGQPYVSRDVPLACNPRGALGHTPGSVSTDFKGAGPTRYSICDPAIGDKCNVVVVSGITRTQFSFGRVVGVEEGFSGTVQSAACNGPCGQSPATPVDLVIIIDRSGSMEDSGSVPNLRSGASSVLTALNPTIQRVGLTMLGASSLSSSCSGSPSGVRAIPEAQSVENVTAPAFQTASTGTNWNVTGGATTLLLDKPAGLAVNDLLVAGITVDGGNNTSVSAPGWTPIRISNSAGDVGLRTFYRKATASDANAVPATFTFNISPAEQAAGGVLRFTGYDTNNPIQTTTTSSGTSNSANVVAQGLTPTISGITLAGFFATDTGTTFTGPSGSNSVSPTMTERFDFRNGNAGGSGPTIMGATGTYTTTNSGGNHNQPSTTGNKTGVAGASNKWAAQLIAINGVPRYPDDTSADLSKWVTVGLSGPGAPVDENYQNPDGTLNTSSRIVKAINCFQVSRAGTNLSTSLDMALTYLLANARPGVKRGIIFETDGAPENPAWGAEDHFTCAAAMASADAVKAADPEVELFTIGYGVAGADCPESGSGFSDTVELLSAMATDSFGTPACNAAENSDGDHFFCQPTGGDLAAVFRAVTNQFTGNRAHLVQLDPLPVVYNLSVHTGTRLGNTTVTVSGKYFTGTSLVKFGGASVTCPSANCTVNSDTTITVRSPAGTNGATVEVIVTTPAGSSPLNPGNPGDSYTYN